MGNGVQHGRQRPDTDGENEAEPRTDPVEDLAKQRLTEGVGERENVDDNGIDVEDTSELLNTYVDNVDTDLDKDRIKGEMKDLMNEAQALDIV